MRHARLPSRHVPAVVVGTLVTAAALAGCGQPGPADEPVAEPAPAVSIPGDLSMGFEGEPSRPEPSASPEAAEDGEASDGAAVDHETCVELQRAWSSTNRALVDLSPEHPRALVQSFRTADRAMADAEPPAEVSGAWSTMSDYLDSAVTAFEDVDEDDANAVSSAVADAITADDTADATAAAKDITGFLSTSCAGK